MRILLELAYLLAAQRQEPAMSDERLPRSDTDLVVLKVRPDGYVLVSWRDAAGREHRGLVHQSHLKLSQPS